MKADYPRLSPPPARPPSSPARPRSCLASSPPGDVSERLQRQRRVGGRPPPHPGRVAEQLGSASARRRTGTSRTRAARSRADRAARVCPVDVVVQEQGGRASASASTKTRARRGAARARCVSVAVEPQSTPSFGTCSSAAAASANAGTTRHELPRASSGVVAVEDPRRCLTCWPKALYGSSPRTASRAHGSHVLPGPRRAGSSSPIRDFPIPAGPKTVTKCFCPLLHSLPGAGENPELAARVRSLVPAPWGVLLADVPEAQPRLTGASFPFATTGCAGRYSMAPRVPGRSLHRRARPRRGTPTEGALRY